MFRIKLYINDLHWKCASYLCKNFRTIYIPKFEVSNMINKNTRNLNKEYTRRMLSLCHYKFRQRLKYLSTTYYRRKVIKCNEVYTSKTCSNCGVLNVPVLLNLQKDSARSFEEAR